MYVTLYIDHCVEEPNCIEGLSPPRVVALVNRIRTQTQERLKEPLPLAYGLERQ